MSFGSRAKYRLLHFRIVPDGKIVKIIIVRLHRHTDSMFLHRRPAIDVIQKGHALGRRYTLQIAIFPSRMNCGGTITAMRSSQLYTLVRVST
jgi:hypothetical protein